MTVATNDTVERYEINGAGPYAFSFRIFNDTDLTIVALSTADPPEVVPLTYLTHYTVTGANVASGGSVSLTSAAYTPYDGYTLDIRSNTPNNQPTSIRNQARFLPEIHEDAFDYLSRQIQDLQRRLDRTVRFSDDNLTDGEMSPIQSWLSKYLAIGPTGLLEPATLTSSGALTPTVIGELLYPRTDAEIAAGIVPTDYTYPPLYLRRYGGQPGMDFDNTDAMEAADAVCAEQGGGIIVIDTPGEWCMNFTFTNDNVKIFMKGGGRAEFDENCIRPFNLASAALTCATGVGGLENQVRYCGLINCHVSGTNRAQGTGVSPPAANCAPHALLLKGGTVGFKADLFCAFYSGIRTVSFEPTAEAPVTHCRIYGVIRNDVTDSADARNIYSIRYADPGYNTSNYVDVKLNKTGMGRPAEVVGSGVSITALFAGYWDIPAGSGGILLDNATIDSDGLHLDPGATNVVVIETTDSNTDLSRVLRGRVIADGQRWKNGSGTEFAIPSGSAQFSFRQVIRQPYVRHPIYIAGTDGSYRETVYRDMLTNDGPEILYGIGEGLGTANNARWVRGHISEEITLSTSGLTTDSVADLLPANSIIEAVCTRTTEAIATATDWAVGDSSVSNRFLTASSTFTLGFTRIGLRHHDGTGTSGPIQSSAAKLRITCTGSNPTTGKVRATVFYRTFVAPTS